MPRRLDMDHAFRKIEAAGDGVEEGIDAPDDGRFVFAAHPGEAVEIGTARKPRPGIACRIVRQEQQDDRMHDAGADQAHHDGVEQPRHPQPSFEMRGRTTREISVALAIGVS